MECQVSVLTIAPPVQTIERRRGEATDNDNNNTIIIIIIGVYSTKKTWQPEG